jgi:hypothetical protein
MLTKANPDNKTFADDPVPVEATHVPVDEAVKVGLQTVHEVADVQTLQFEGHAVEHVGMAVPYPD